MYCTPVYCPPPDKGTRSLQVKVTIFPLKFNKTQFNIYNTYSI